MRQAIAVWGGPSPRRAGERVFYTVERIHWRRIPGLSLREAGIVGRSEQVLESVSRKECLQWLAAQQPAISEDPMPRYKCKSIAALDIALGGLPAKMQVEADVGTGVSAKTVGELRKVTTWSENLVITTPQEHHPESAVKISKASVATRTSPKP